MVTWLLTFRRRTRPPGERVMPGNYGAGRYPFRTCQRSALAASRNGASLPGTGDPISTESGRLHAYFSRRATRCILPSARRDLRSPLPLCPGRTRASALRGMTGNTGTGTVREPTCSTSGRMTVAGRCHGRAAQPCRARRPLPARLPACPRPDRRLPARTAARPGLPQPGYPRPAAGPELLGRPGTPPSRHRQPDPAAAGRRRLETADAHPD
jgi:hypothetical protein